MEKRNLNKINKLTLYSMTFVMALAWILSVKCRHAESGQGILRDAREDLE